MSRFQARFSHQLSLSVTPGAYTYPPSSRESSRVYLTDTVNPVGCHFGTMVGGGGYSFMELSADVTDTSKFVTPHTRSFDARRYRVLMRSSGLRGRLHMKERDVDDLVQETFLRAYRSWYTFLLSMDCRRWLLRDLPQRIPPQPRKSQRREFHGQGDLDALPAVIPHAHAVRDADGRAVTQIELVPALRDALEMLAEPFRSVGASGGQRGTAARK